MSDRRRLLRDLALLLLILLPYFLLLIAARPLNVPDEGRYPEIAREMLVSGDFITPRVNGAVFLDKPALYYWLEAASMKAFGVNTAAIRLPPALFGVFGCLLTFLAGYRFFNRRTAWFSAFALASFPLYFDASQYANLDLEVATWITASLFGFLFAQAEPEGSPQRRRYFILAYLAGGLGVLTKGLIGIVLPAVVIFAWMLWQRRWRELPRWGLAWLPVCVLLVCLPWYCAVQIKNPQFLHFFFIYQQFERFTGGGFNNVRPWWFYPAILMLGLLPWSLNLPSALREAWQGRHRDQGVRAFLLAWLAVILLFFSLPASKIPSYILPVVPPLALLMGTAFDGWLAQNNVGKVRPLVAALLLLGIAGSLFACAWLMAGKTTLLHGLPPRTVAALAKYSGHTALPWLLAGLGVTLLGAAIALLYARRRALGVAVVGLTLAGAGIGGWVVPMVPCFDQQPIPDVAAALRPLLTPDTVVATYDTYYEDLPIYLNRDDYIRVVGDWSDPNIVKVDNWRREFYFALKDQPGAGYWLIGNAEFTTLLNSSKPVFVVVETDRADAVATRFALNVVWRSARRCILSRSTMVPKRPVAAQ